MNRDVGFFEGGFDLLRDGDVGEGHQIGGHPPVLCIEVLCAPFEVKQEEVVRLFEPDAVGQRRAVAPGSKERAFLGKRLVEFNEGVFFELEREVEFGTAYEEPASSFVSRAAADVVIFQGEVIGDRGADVFFRQIKESPPQGLGRWDRFQTQHSDEMGTSAEWRRPSRPGLSRFGMGELDLKLGWRSRRGGFVSRMTEGALLSKLNLLDFAEGFGAKGHAPAFLELAAGDAKQQEAIPLTGSFKAPELIGVKQHLRIAGHQRGFQIHFPAKAIPVRLLHGHSNPLLLQGGDGPP